MGFSAFVESLNLVKTKRRKRNADMADGDSG
jgi:hypothetical protein